MVHMVYGKGVDMVAGTVMDSSVGGEGNSGGRRVEGKATGVQ